MCKSLKSDKISRRLVERNVKKIENTLNKTMFCFVGKPGHVATTKITQNGSEWHTTVYFAVVNGKYFENQ